MLSTVTRTAGPKRKRTPAGCDAACGALVDADHDVSIMGQRPHKRVRHTHGAGAPRGDAREQGREDRVARATSAGGGDPRRCILDVPDEIIWCVASHLDGSSLARLGASCWRLAGVCADEVLWRAAFESDYGRRLYGGASAGVASPDAHPNVPSMPAWAAPDRAMPVPFAHMGTVAGRGWRWLYAAHARADALDGRSVWLPEAQGSPRTRWVPRPAPDVRGSQAGVQHGSCRPADAVDPSARSSFVWTFLGDRFPSGAARASASHCYYGVEVCRDGAGTVAGWVEALWVRADAGAAEAFPLRPAVVLSRSDGVRRFVIDPSVDARALASSSYPLCAPRSWTAPVVPGVVVSAPKAMVYKGPCRNGVPHGTGTVVEASGRSWNVVSSDGTTLSTVYRPGDARVRAVIIRRVASCPEAAATAAWLPPAMPAPTSPPTVVASLFANGDALYVLRIGTVRTGAFFVSPSLIQGPSGPSFADAAPQQHDDDDVDARLAGRWVTSRSWAHTNDLDLLAMYPLDDDSEDARLLRARIAAGRCGWTEAAQREIALMAAAGPLRLASRAPVPGVPSYGVFTSPDPYVALALPLFQGLHARLAKRRIAFSC